MGQSKHNNRFLTKHCREELTATMRFKTKWPLWASGGLGCLLLGMMIAKWTLSDTSEYSVAAKLPRNQDSEDIRPAPRIAPAHLEETAPAPISASREKLEPPVSPEANIPPKPAKPAASEQASAQPPRDHWDFTDPVAKEALGRHALSYVGDEPLADEVWATLINDPDLSPKVREDLIEDLNENGFSEGNGRRATVEDLPLIESRIQLIEEHWQFAMDEANDAAFAEVYKDLINMWWRLNQ
jgi:hypothetical protein